MTPEERERLRQLAEFDIEPKDGSWRSQVLRLLDEIERLEAQRPEHASCRQTEQRLREANRRLQAEGPALERDKLIIQLREQLAALEAENQLLKESRQSYSGKYTS